MKPTRPKKRVIKTRDYALVKLINGATKAGVHTDRKKKANKAECRKTVDGTEQ